MEYDLAADAARLTDLGFDVFPCRITLDEDTGDKITDFLGIRWQDSVPPDVHKYPRANMLFVRLPVDTVVLDIDNIEKFDSTGLRVTPGAKWSNSRRGLHVFYRTDGRDVPQIVDPGETGYDTRVGGKGIVFAWNPSDWVAASEWTPAEDWLYHRPHVKLQELIDRSNEGGIVFPLTSDNEIIRWLGSIYTAGMTPADLIAMQKAAYADGRIVATARPWTDEDFERHTRASRNWEPVNATASVEGLPSSDGTIRNILDYLRGVPEHVPWLIKNIAFANGITLISGEPKAGKSTFAAQIMTVREAEYDNQESFLGEGVTVGPTLLVTEESGVPVRYKVGHLSKLDVYDLSAAGGEKFTATLQKIVDWANERCVEHTGLVLIDTLSVWAGIEDENDATQVTNALKLIKQVAQAYNVSIILVHHQRKSGGTNGVAIRGSGALLANVDHVLELKRVSEESSDRRLNTMGRVSEPEYLWMGYDKETKVYTLKDPEDGDLAEMEAELDAIPREGDGPGLLRHETGLSDQKLTTYRNKGRLHVELGGGARGTANLYWSVPRA